MKIIKLSSSNCDVYSEKLAQYIYESVKNSAFEKFCTYQEAVEKYSELKGYLQQNQTISHAAIKDNELIGFIWAYKYSFRDDKNRQGDKGLFFQFQVSQLNERVLWLSVQKASVFPN